MKIDDEFAKLRAEDADKVPPFEAMWRPRPKGVSRWWLAAPAAAVPALAVAAVMIFWIAAPHPESAPAVTSAAPTPVQAVTLDPEPLDFLLDDPTLASAPDFDTNPIHP
jgi:hypothetical protein